jgi:hypothetical protein
MMTTTSPDTAGDEDMGVIGVSFDVDGEREYGRYHVVKHADGSFTVRPYDDEAHLV